MKIFDGHYNHHRLYFTVLYSANTLFFMYTL